METHASGPISSSLRGLRMASSSGWKQRLETIRSLGRLATSARYLSARGGATVAGLFEERVRRDPQGLALAWLSKRFSWSDVDQQARRYAVFFAQEGVRPGDVVAIVMENRPDYLFALMGLARLGAAASLINNNLVEKALIHAIMVCDAQRILVGAERLAAVEDIASDLKEMDLDRNLWVRSDEDGPASTTRRVIDSELAAADPAVAPSDPSPKAQNVFCYIYTSGTTGLPKAALIRNNRMLMAGVSFGHLMLRASPGDVVYVTLPLYHSSGMFLGWGGALSTGAAIALRRKFSATNFWTDVRDFQATSFIYIGELCRYLLNRPVQEGERDHRLKLGVGNGMRGDVWIPFQERFGIPIIREFYGATEGNAPTLNMKGRPGMIGKLQFGQAIVRCDMVTGEPIRNAEGYCERVSPGEIGLMIGRISSVMSFDGYVDKAATQKKILTDVFKAGDQWFDSGDLIEFHQGKWLSFADRAGDTFRWKGENVSTNEVADIIDAATGVSEANVYGVEIPNADGRAGMAAISVDGEFDLDSFAQWVETKLASYQRPLFLRLLQGSMNITGTFKHQKVEYRDEAWDLDRISDPLFALVDGRYVALDRELSARIQSGDQILG